MDHLGLNLARIFPDEDRYQQASRFGSLTSLGLFVALGLWLALNPLNFQGAANPNLNPAYIALELFEAPEPEIVEPAIPVAPPEDMVPELTEPEPMVAVPEAEPDEPEVMPFTSEIVPPPPPEKPKEVKRTPIAATPQAAAEPQNTQVATSEPTATVSASQQEAFISAFVKTVEKNKFYPNEARNKGLTGQVKIRVTFDGQGLISSIELVDGDYPVVLGQAALKTMQTVKKRWQAKLGAPNSLVVPISFKLR
ncbi:MAG: TonB family protein [Deltaproteobacteria bacterium]|jgi:protein TonB|nr:TonB family protein [Deltaproteobacteria bacterium]